MANAKMNMQRFESSFPVATVTQARGTHMDATRLVEVGLSVQLSALLNNFLLS